jgi:hypothetical protein
MPDTNELKLGARQKTALLWVAGRCSAAKVTPSALQDLVRLKLAVRAGKAMFSLTETGLAWLAKNAP